MKLRSLAVNQFKKYTCPTRLDGIGDGLNVVIGPNEMGKSTLLDALRAVLFEKHGSKAQPIVALQNERNPGGPVVELAFDLDDGRYCIVKRFLRKPYALLTGPNGRQLTSDAAEDELRRLLGFDEPGKAGAKPETLGMWNVLWVQQGQSFGTLALPDSARASLHGALEAEVGTVLGGRRGREIPQAIERRLSALRTSTGRPRGPYKELIEQASALTDDLAELRRRRDELSGTRAALEDKLAELERLSSTSRDAADRQELTVARQRLVALTEIAARIRAGRSELELKQRDLDQAVRTSEERSALIRRLEADGAELATAADHLAMQAAAERRQRAIVAGLRTTARAAAADLVTAEERAVQARRVRDIVQRAARIAELESRQRQAAAAEARLHAAQQDAAAILVTDEEVKRIRRADKALAAVRTSLAAVATTVTLEFAAEHLAALTINGGPVRQPRFPVIEPATIEIPGRGRIVIEPAIADRESLLAAERSAAAQLAAALSDTSVRSVDEAEAQWQRRQRLLDEAALARQAVALYAPAGDGREAGAAALAAEIAGLRDIVRRDLDTLGLARLPATTDAEAALTQADEAVQAARLALAEAQAALKGPEEALARSGADLAVAKARHETLHHQIDGRRRQLAAAHGEASEQDLADRVRAAQAAVARQQMALAALEAACAGETLDQLAARVDRLDRVLRDRDERRHALQVEVQGLRSSIEAVEGVGLDEAIEQTARKLLLCEAESKRIGREIDVLQLLSDTLRAAERRAKERYLAPIVNRLQRYLAVLFPGAEIVIDEDLHVTGLIRDGGHQEAFDHLSLGTQEQIAVLVRLAFAEMLVDKGHPATVILDDALVFSDDQRIAHMFDILTLASRRVQILVLTCREDLFGRLGGHRLELRTAAATELASA